MFLFVVLNIFLQIYICNFYVEVQIFHFWGNCVLLSYIGELGGQGEEKEALTQHVLMSRTSDSHFLFGCWCPWMWRASQCWRCPGLHMCSSSPLAQPAACLSSTLLPPARGVTRIPVSGSSCSTQAVLLDRTPSEWPWAGYPPRCFSNS